MDKFINDLQCQDTVQVSKTLEDFSNAVVNFQFCL